MKYHFCPICWAEVRHPQQTTCGGLDCRDAWRHLNSAARRTRANLATFSPSERALALAQGPSHDELQAQEEMRETLATELEEHQAQQATKGPGPSLRDLLAPSNAPIVKEDS